MFLLYNEKLDSDVFFSPQERILPVAHLSNEYTALTKNN